MNKSKFQIVLEETEEALRIDKRVEKETGVKSKLVSDCDKFLKANNGNN